MARNKRSNKDEAPTRPNRIQRLLQPADREDPARFAVWGRRIYGRLSSHHQTPQLPEPNTTGGNSYAFQVDIPEAGVTVIDAAPRRGRRSSVRHDAQGIGSAYPNHEEPATRQPPSTAPYPSIRAGRALRRHDTIPGGRHPYAPSAPNDHVVSGPSRRSHQHPASVSQDVQVVHLIPANVTYDPIPVSPALSASPSRGIAPWHGATPQSSGALYDPGFTTAHLPPLSAYGPTTGLPYIPEFTHGPGGEYQSQMGAFLDPVAQYALDQELALGRFENLTPEPPAPISWNGHPMSQQAVPSLNLSYGAEYLTVGPFQGIQPIPTHQDLWPTMLGGMVAVHSPPNLPWPSPDTGYFGPSFSDDPDF